MKRGVLIGLTGPAFAGKGEVAIGMFAHAPSLNLVATEVYFARKLWEMISALTGRPVSWLRDRKNKDTVLPEYGVTPRRFAQTLGSDWGRKMIREDLWAREGLWEADGFVRDLGESDRHVDPLVVFTDVRFDDEAQGIVDRGGVVCEIVRPDGPACEAHWSERGISRHLISRTIVNDGSLADLHAAGREALDATLKDIAAGGKRSDGRKQGCAP